MVLWRDAALKLAPPHSWMTLPVRNYSDQAAAGADHRSTHLCHYLAFPNTIFSCFPTHLQMWSTWPVSVSETVLSAWGVVGPAPEGVNDEKWAKRNERDWDHFLARRLRGLRGHQRRRPARPLARLRAQHVQHRGGPPDGVPCRSERWDSLTLRIAVERGSCNGYGNCVRAAEDIFDVDDDGLVVLNEEVVGDERLEQIQRAAYDCPTASITYDRQ